jgi:hypothetical protein
MAQLRKQLDIPATMQAQSAWHGERRRCVFRAQSPRTSPAEQLGAHLLSVPAHVRGAELGAILRSGLFVLSRLTQFAHSSPRVWLAALYTGHFTLIQDVECPDR